MTLYTPFAHMILCICNSVHVCLFARMTLYTDDSAAPSSIHLSSLSGIMLPAAHVSQSPFWIAGSHLAFAKPWLAHSAAAKLPKAHRLVMSCC